MQIPTDIPLEEYLNDKRLVFITADTYPSLAGSGRNVFYFAHFLSQYARSTTIVVLNYNKELDEIEDFGQLKVVRVTYHKANALKRIALMPNLLMQIKQSINRSDIVLFYGAFFPGFDYLVLLARFMKKKLVFRSTFFGGDDLRSVRRRNPILWPLRNYVYKSFNLYFAINRKFEDSWKSVFKDKIPVFRSFQGVNTNVFKIIDPKERDILRKQLDLPGDVPVLLSCGYLVKRKGYHKIFEELAKLDIPFVYLIVGAFKREKHQKISLSEQREMQELYNMGKTLLGDKVHYLGLVKRMERIYPLANYFLHGATGEGTPNVLLEAMAMGVPVVIRKIEGVVGEELIHNENALVYDNYTEITELILYLINNPIKAASIGHNGSILIQEDYNYETVAKQLFYKILNG